MSKADDVNTLFRRFGGDASTYQEVVAEQQVHTAVARWPMLDQISPSVRPHVASQPLAQPTSGARTHHAVPEALPTARVADRTLPVAEAFKPSPVLAPEPAPVATSTVRLDAVEIPQTLLASDSPVSAQPAAPVPAPRTEERTESRPLTDWPDASRAASPEAGSTETDLKAMFQRMVPKKPEVKTAVPESSLKRLAKW